MKVLFKGKDQVKLVNFWRCGSKWNAELSCEHLKENFLGISSIFKGNYFDSFHYNEYLIQHMNIYFKKSLISKYNVYIHFSSVKYFNEMFAVANVIQQLCFYRLFSIFFVICVGFFPFFSFSYQHFRKYWC